ncbi:MAG: ABC transporter ATP-binding protein [Alphaproteobacteria bacterium]|nr:ABC transporter ATP-binding protein [Alphaproteobacteria bacterium]
MRAVSHAYGDRTVLSGVDLAVAPGEIVCLVGPSGCGKTTTLRLAAGLEPLQMGHVAIDAVTVGGPDVDVPTEKRHVGLMFQDYALFPHKTVLDNVMFGLTSGLWRRAKDRGTVERRGRALNILADIGMADFADAYPHTLSGGQQQRVALARALAPSPRVMLLDEPFSGLDSQLRGQMRDDAMHLLKSRDAATLLVTHDSEEAMFMADRIAVMRAGRIEQIGTPLTIYCEPANAFVASVFSEINRIQGVVAGGWVATPLGPVAAPGFAESRAVEVLIRPEAIRLGPAGKPGQSQARVQAARMLGRSSLIHLSLSGRVGGTLHLHARVPGRFLPSENEILGITLDAEQTFVFPSPEKSPP